MIYRGFIPDENMCWVPETLMLEILAEVHYLPDSWRGQAHSTFVRDQFAHLFQYKAVNYNFFFFCLNLNILQRTYFQIQGIFTFRTYFAGGHPSDIIFQIETS